MSGMGRNVMALVAVLLLAGGCASGTGGMQNLEMEDSSRTTIRVLNQNWSDMTIYLERNGLRQRLGTVTSQATGVFVVATHLIESSGQVHLIADPIGSSRLFASPPLLIQPGQTAEWRLENSLPLSSMWIR